MKFPLSVLSRGSISRKITAAVLGGATALALLAGCSHVPITSVPALAAIDFQTTELAPCAPRSRCRLLWCRKLTAFGSMSG